MSLNNIRKILLITLPILLFIVIAMFIETNILTHFEGYVYNKSTAYMSTTLTKAIKIFTHLGDPIAVLSICFILILIPLTRFKLGIPASITVIISIILNIILKSVFARQRPDILKLINETSYSFPSGHAMVNTALYVMVMLTITNIIKNKNIQLLIRGLCILMIMIISFSRIYLGVHYLGDVVGGCLLGFSIAVIIYNIYIKLSGNFIKKQ
jgi:undecaprenyl-diphosphatase